MSLNLKLQFAFKVENYHQYSPETFQTGHIIALKSEENMETSTHLPTHPVPPEKLVTCVNFPALFPF